MAPNIEKPEVKAGGLVTVAFLKAQLDSNNDHLGIFMPLVEDVIQSYPAAHFTTADVQTQLLSDHGIAIPQQVISTLLNRLKVSRTLRREAGTYVRLNSQPTPSKVQAAKAEIEEDQEHLGKALQSYAERHGLLVRSHAGAVEMLLRFLEAEQVGVLLDVGLNGPTTQGTNSLETTVVAEFIQFVARKDPALVVVLRRMLEGLVLYHAAFLPDLAQSTQKFKHLRVVFDSSLVRQALGYEGDAMRLLMIETLSLLKGASVQCLVFDKTVQEIHRILAVYESKLGTTRGRESLRPSPMARHFLQKQYAPSDVKEISALLENEIEGLGFQIAKLPVRKHEHTLGEGQLIARLAAPGSPSDEIEPRVAHDVDCIAGVLQLREGAISTKLEEIRAVFAASSPLLIRNVRLWWIEDEQQNGIEPVVNIRGLANLAWLKKPTLNADFKIKELIALCSAAMRPSQQTWTRFLRHLDSLKRTNRITSDEVSAILVSALSDRLLRETEDTETDPEDIDAGTLDEIVDRVKSTYATARDQEIAAIRQQMQKEILDQQAAFSKQATEAAALLARANEKDAGRKLRNRQKVIRWARTLRSTLQPLLNLVLLIGAIAIIAEHPLSSTLDRATLIGVVFFVFIEFVALRHHISTWLEKFEEWATNFLERSFYLDEGEEVKRILLKHDEGA